VGRPENDCWLAVDVVFQKKIMKTRINRIMCYVLSSYYYQLLADGYEVERVSGHVAYMIKEQKYLAQCGGWQR
jgi:hypothetical protein